MLGSLDIVKFIQAIYPCIQQNYPQLFSGLTQIVGGASLLMAAFRSSNLGSAVAPGGVLGGLLGMLNKVALNPPAAPKQ
jgi:hypothetical protein